MISKRTYKNKLTEDKKMEYWYWIQRKKGEKEQMGHAESNKWDGRFKPRYTNDDIKCK